MIGGMFFVWPICSLPMVQPLKISNTNSPNPYESTAGTGWDLIAVQPELTASGGVYLPESGTTLPYVFIDQPS